MLLSTTTQAPTTITTATVSRYEYQVLPRDQGQIVELSYAVDWDLGILVRSVADRSDRSVAYEVSELADDPGEYEPKNGVLPRHGAWVPVEEEDAAACEGDCYCRDVEEWTTVARYVACCYGTDGDEPGDCYARIGRAPCGCWWADDGDDDERQSLGRYASEALARAAAESAAAEQDKSEAGEDAASLALRLLAERAGQPEPTGEWCVYWETVLDDPHPCDRYPTRDAAEAAATLASGELRARHPGGGLLCHYGVRYLEGGDWIRPDGI